LLNREVIAKLLDSYCFLTPAVPNPTQSKLIISTKKEPSMQENKSNNDNELAAKSAELAQDAAELIEGVKAKATEIGVELKTKAAETGAEIKQRAASAEDSLIAMVQAHPYRSLAIAFASGLMLAKCLR
jgi:ElaB/YqjD/DUF883 family membrane-anchored ribosome-binding protein